MLSPIELRAQAASGQASLRSPNAPPNGRSSSVIGPPLGRTSPCGTLEKVGQGGRQASSAGTVAPDDGRPATALAGEPGPPSGPTGGGHNGGDMDRDVERDPDRDRDPTTMRIADLVFAVAVVATFVCYFVKSRYFVLNGDD